MVKSRLILVCVVAIILLGLFACSSVPKELSIDASSSGKEVEVAVGGSLTVTLESNPSTGFKWELAQITDETVLQLSDHKFEPPEAAGNGAPIVGAPGTEVWTFKAVKKGKSILSLEYSQPWEQGAKAARVFVLTVLVE